VTGGIPPYVRLANEIAVQFHAVRSDVAVESIAAHLRSFWDPRMRSQLLAYVAAGAAGLDPLAVEAAAHLDADGRLAHTEDPGAPTSTSASTGTCRHRRRLARGDGAG
jgi:formate dehydrogenase subunit delta